MNAWLLVRLDEDGATDLERLAAHYDIDPDRVRAAAADLVARGFLTTPPVAGRPAEITATGCAVLERLVEARRQHLTETLLDWGPERRAEVAAAIARLSRDLVPDPTARA